MDRWKAEMGRVREEKRRRKKIKKRKSQKKKDPGARKGRKVAKHCVFPMICGSGGSKSRLAKAAGAEPAGQMSDEKVHTVVARSTFRSQKAKNTRGSDHFWKLRCWKSARCCGAKHISKSKCTKHTSSGPLLEVEMSKKCTPLSREAHVQLKMYKAHHSRTTFGSCDVKKVPAVVARSTFRSQHVQNTPFSNHFWKLRCRKSARRCGAKHISKSKCTKHTILGPLLEVQMSKGLWTLSKVSKTWGFCAISKNDGKRGTFEEDLGRCIFRGRRSTRDMFIRAVRRSGRWFPERGCILEDQIFSFGKKILCDRCSTSQ